MRNAVTEFHSSSSNFLRYFPKVQNVATKTDKKKMMKEFWVVGIFVKRLTCLYPTKERMRLFVNYVRKVETSLRINAAVTGGSDCVCQTLVCYGTLIHAFIAGWEESECLYVHQVLEQISRMNTNTLSILESLYGNNEAMEMYARRYYNLVYIRPGRTCREQAFWISRVLKDKPIVYQAKLVFIIFGPIDQSDRVYWEAVTNEDLVYDHQSYLTDLASLFNLLQKCSQEWTNDDVLSLFEDLTETPAAWLKENVANLLLLCGNPLDKLYIENKLANGKQKELAELFVYMVLVCSRHDNCVRKVVDHFENIYHSTRSRRLQSTLLQAIALAHEELTIKLLESALDSPNGTEAAERFESPPVPTYLKFYLFNVTNPEEVNLRGAKPNLDEIGPFVYRQIKKKVVKEWNEREGTITYQEVPTFYFEESMSVEDGLDSTFYHLNAPDVGAADFINKATLLTMPVSRLLPWLRIFAGVKFGPLIVSHTARELLFDGYKAEKLEMLVKYAGAMLGIPDNIMPDFMFGVFYGKNNTPSHDIVIRSGVRGISDFGEIVSFNDSKVLPYWVENSTCASLNGTDGTAFHPMLDRNEPLYAFSPDVCRSLKMVYSGESQVKGIDTFRYLGPPELFEANEENMCFCMRDRKECNLSGVLPIATCQKGNPVVLSLPHFHQGHQGFRDFFTGLHPDPEKHDSFLDVEPMTGVVLNGRKRLQANFEVTPFKNPTFLAKVPHMVFPILWLSEEGIVDEAKAEEIRERLLGPVELGHLGLRVLIYTGVGLVLITTTVYAAAKCCFKHKRHFGAQNRSSFSMSSMKEMAAFSVESQPLHDTSISGKIVKTTLKNGFHIIPALPKDAALTVPLSQ